MRTGVGGARFRQKNEDRSRYFRLCNRRHVVNGRRRWIVEASSIPLKIVKSNGENYKIHDKEMLVIIRGLES